MYSNTLTPGCFYSTTRPGLKVKYLGNYEGISLETGKKVKVPRKIVTAQLMVYDYARGLAEGRGCVAEIQPNGGIHITGPDLDGVRNLIYATHGFAPTLYAEYTIDGVPQPGYSRIEIHPSMVVDKDAR